MYSGMTIVQDPAGLHARPASRFVREAKRFSAGITVRRSDGEEANAKSMVMLMGLGVGQGERVEIIASGPDERDAVDSLLALVHSGLDA